MFFLQFSTEPQNNVNKSRQLKLENEKNINNERKTHLFSLFFLNFIVETKKNQNKLKYSLKKIFNSKNIKKYMNVFHCYLKIFTFHQEFSAFLKRKKQSLISTIFLRKNALYNLIYTFSV